MNESPGNVLALFEAALAKGAKGVTVTADQMRQLLREHSYLVAGKNHLVRAGTWDQVLDEAARNERDAIPPG